jgi:hypothetical protein
VANQVPDLYGDVDKFMAGCGQDRMLPGMTPLERYAQVMLRMRLIGEEAKEVDEALLSVGDGEFVPEYTSDEAMLRCRTELTKELCDLLYVTIGAFVGLGLPYAEAWEIVQRSNMAKVANPRFDETGKLLKPEGWVAPYGEIEKIVKEKTNA